MSREQVIKIKTGVTLAVLRSDSLVTKVIKHDTSKIDTSRVLYS